MEHPRGGIGKLYALEQLAGGNTCIHKLHPGVKLAATFLYIVAVIASGRYNILQLSLFMFYPAIIIALSEIPFLIIMKRYLVALPFVLMAGLSNIIFDRETAFVIGNVSITFGALSFLALLLRSFYCVSALLMLVATTSFGRLTNTLRRIHVPSILVLLFEMIYRYLSVLLNEASEMYTAYMQRSLHKKGIKLKDMGAFVGQLFIRSYDKAERVYAAMKLRGYGSAALVSIGGKMSVADIVYLGIVCLYSAGVLIFVGR